MSDASDNPRCDQCRFWVPDEADHDLGQYTGAVVAMRQGRCRLISATSFKGARVIAQDDDN